MRRVAALLISLLGILACAGQPIVVTVPVPVTVTAVPDTLATRVAATFEAQDVSQSVAATVAAKAVPVPSPESTPTEVPTPNREQPTPAAVPSPTVPPSPTPPPTPIPTPEPITVPEGLSTADLVRALRPAIIRIDTVTPDGGGTGSGVIYDSSGLAMTNNHVVEGATSIVVTIRELSDSTPLKFEAEVLGTDPARDLAVIRIIGSGFSTLEIGGSSDVSPGDDVLAIGFPLGIEGDISVSGGIVSRLLKSNNQSLIQHDAKILSGNSGGPLVTRDGLVVGINSFVIQDRLGIDGLNMAIGTEEFTQRLASLETGGTGTAIARHYVSSTYGFEFDVPAGWTLIEDTPERVYAFDPVTNADFVVEVDPESLGINDAEIWATYSYYAGRIFVEADTYELISWDTDEREDGANTWVISEQWSWPGDGFLSVGVETFIYNRGFGTKLYTSAPLDVFNSVEDSLVSVLESFIEPEPHLKRDPGPSDLRGGECIGLNQDASFIGSLTNTSLIPPISGDLLTNFFHIECAIVGELYLGSSLVGSGALIGFIDGNHIEFTIPANSNDAGVDLEFEGEVTPAQISGSYSVPDAAQAGVWNMFIANGSPISRDLATPTATPFPVPTVIPTPRPISTPVPTPTPVGPLVFGPSSGSLDHDPDDGLIKLVGTGPSGLRGDEYSDAIVAATFINPYSSSQGSFDYGFILRREDGGGWDSIVVDSSRRWEHTSRLTREADTEETIATGFLPTGQINLSARQSNELLIVMVGERAWFAVNGTPVAELSLATRELGFVWAGSGFVDGREREGFATNYRDFRVIPLFEGLSENDISIEGSDTSIQYHYSGVSADDFMAVAKFNNPVSSSGKWSYGISFRNSLTNFSDKLILDSGSRWSHFNRPMLGEDRVLIDSGTSAAIQNAPREINELVLLEVDQTAYVYVNGSGIAALRLSEGTDVGTIDLLVAFFAGDQGKGTFTEVSEFSVYVAP